MTTLEALGRVGCRLAMKLRIKLGIKPLPMLGADDVFAALSVVRNSVPGMIAPGRRIVHAHSWMPALWTTLDRD
jgi:hypothetical protein